LVIRESKRGLNSTRRPGRGRSSFRRKTLNHSI